MRMARQKIAGILCVFQDFLTQPAAFGAAKMCAGAIGTASKVKKHSIVDEKYERFIFLTFLLIAIAPMFEI